MTETKGWRNIALRLLGGESSTNSGYIIRNHYERLLLQFEREESKISCKRHSSQAIDDYQRPISKSPVGYDSSSSTAKRMRVEGIEIYQGLTPTENRTDPKDAVVRSYEIDASVKAQGLGVNIANKGDLNEKLIDTLYHPAVSTASRKDRKSGSQSTSSEISNKRARQFPFRTAFFCGLCRKDCFDVKELGPQVPDYIHTLILSHEAVTLLDNRA